MKKFVGEWRLSAIYDPEDANKMIGVRAYLEQDLLPSFVPPFCGGMLRNVSKRVIQRLVEDINILTEKYHNGTPFEELLKPKKGKTEQAAFPEDVDPTLYEGVSEQPKSNP